MAADWVWVAEEKELDKVLRVDCAGRELAIFRLEQDVFALDDICSHEFSRLSEGEVWDGRVYCPKHGSGFDIRSGAVVGPPASAPVNAFAAKIEGGGVWVRLNELEQA